MKQIILLTFSFLTFLTISSYAATRTEKIVIYVNDFTVSGKNTKTGFGAAIAGTVADTISSSPKVDVITIETRRKAIQELAFSQLTSENQTTAARILAADYTINGSYITSGDMISITAEIIDLSDMSIIDSFHLDGRTSRIQEVASNVGFNIIVLMKKHALLDNDIIENPVNRIQPSLKAYTYYSLGLKAFYDNPGSAYEYFLKASSSDPEYVDALIDAASSALDLSLYDSAVNMVSNGEKILNRYNLKNTVQFSRLMQVKGMLYYKLQNYPVADEAYTSSIYILSFLKMNGSSYEAESKSGLALILRKKGKYDQALSEYRSALKILDNLGIKNSIQYSELLNNIAVTETAKGNYDNALKYNDSSLEIKKNIGLQKSKTFAVTLSNRGVIMASMNKNAEAIEITGNAIKILRMLHLENTDEYAMAESNTGFFYAAINNNTEAIKMFEDAQKIREKTGNIRTKDYFKTAVKLAESYNASGDSCKALKTIEDAFSSVKTREFATDNDFLFINKLEKSCRK